MEIVRSPQPFIQPFHFDSRTHAAKAGGAHAGNPNIISFSLLGATAETYKNFMKNLRKTLTANCHMVYEIPVLPASASGSARFILVHLTNYKGESINIAIDVVNIYIVAYQAGNKAYYLNDASKEAKSVLFKGIKHEVLPYKGNYDGLESAAGKISREKIDLGFSELSSSIGNMFHYHSGASVPRSFIVAIQMISEAVRFKYIEKRVSKSVETKFTPDPGFLSLENKWSNLSEQIQKAQTRGGEFERPVWVRSVKNKPIKVDNVGSDVVKGVAVLLYSDPSRMLMSEFNE